MRRLLTVAGLALGLFACEPFKETGIPSTPIEDPQRDEDRDGVPHGEDCDDTDPSVRPDANEVCNGIDDDCDGLIDDADPGVDVVGQSEWFPDDDGDGFGAEGSTADLACDQPSGYAAEATDCDDASYDVNPAASEVCNLIDDDCDGFTDDADSSVDPSTFSDFYLDGDLDGYGAGKILATACAGPEGTVPDGSDCDDFNPEVNPGASEVCNQLDDNCDGLVDAEDPSIDSKLLTAWYPDNDFDGYGDEDAEPVMDCSAPAGMVADDSDCNDADPNINPDGAEICNGLDDDCDRFADDADPSVDPAGFTDWYTDGDGDGYGDGTVGPAATTCDAPKGTVADSSDCDDLLSEVNPGAPEICSGLDDDCDGLVDNDDPSLDLSTQLDWYPDADGDGYGVDRGFHITACEGPAGSGPAAGDCDDADPDIHPGAAEQCNGIDDDCDPGTSDAGTAGFLTDGGVWLDLTDTLGAGVAGSPANVALDQEGVLYVCAGTWYAGLDITASVDVIGFDGAASTVLTGEGTRSLVTLDDPSLAVSVEAITLDNGSAHLDFADRGPGYEAGGAVHCEGTSDLVLRDVIIRNSSAFTGGAVSVEDCSVTVEDAEIYGNFATASGGAFSVVGGTLTVVGATVYDNLTDAFGGAFEVGSYMDSYPSAITLPARADLYDTVVTGNLAADGGGLAIEKDAEVTCHGDGAFTLNEAVGGGGAVQFSSDATFTSYGCDFGSALTADDNTPDDINGSVATALDVAEWVECTLAGCADFPLDVDALVPGDLVITEIMKNPAAVDDTVGEWFEVLNPTAEWIRLDGLEIADDGGDLAVLSTGFVLEPGALVVIGNNDLAATNGGAPVDIEVLGLSLASGVDQIVLQAAGGEIDRVAYDTGGTWPNGIGASIQVDSSAQDAASNNSGANWCLSASPYGDGDLGSPGAPNPGC